MTATADCAIAATAQRYCCTFGTHTQTVWTDRRTLSWPELGELLTHHAIGFKEGTCIVPAVFRGDRRAKSDAERIDVALLDSDAGATLDEIAAAVRSAGWAAVVSSTHSHLTTTTKANQVNWDRFKAARPADAEAAYLVEVKGMLPRIAAGAIVARETEEFVYFKHQPCPKFRVAILLLRPWRAADYPSQDVANAVWKERIEALAAALGLQHDQACTDTSRLFFLPRRPANGPPAETCIIEGASCDIFALAGPASGGFDADLGANTASDGNAADGASQAKDSHDYIDSDTGEVSSLRDWAREYGNRFKIADAIRAQRPSVLTGRVADGIKVHIRCPNESAHTEPGTDGATFVINAGEAGNKGFVVHCRHAHCTGQDRLFFVRRMLECGCLKVEDLTDAEFLTAADQGAQQAEPPPHPDDAAEPGHGYDETEQPAPDAPGLREFLSIEAWATRDIPPADRLLGDLVTTTTRMFLVGRTGLGKTLLGFAIGIGMASGAGFLHWRAARPAKVLIIDGEMPGELIKARSIDALRRHASAPHPTFLTIYSRDMEDDFARRFPTLGRMPPLNSEDGQNFVLALIGALGGVDVVIFDNVMSLITGDQKDEVPWSETLPLVASLTAKRIGQVWLDHTGHNTDRQYGSATKAWRFDAVGLLAPLPDDKRERHEVAFTLSFEPPGKARRRTPDNWADFETCTIRLNEDQWTSDRSEAVQTKPKEARLKDRPALMLREARRLIGTQGSRIQPAPDAATVRGVSRQVLRKHLIAAGWFPENLLRTAPDSEPELTRDAYGPENSALTTLKRNGFLAFNRDWVWLP